MSASTEHNFIVGTFRSPYLYTFTFDVATHTLTQKSKQTAFSGHSWLSLSSDKKFLYATCWSDPPSLASYDVHKKASEGGVIELSLINSIASPYLSGYVTCNSDAVFSACGPEVHSFTIDKKNGGFAMGETGTAAEPVSTHKLYEGDLKLDGKEMSFGGLRHGGHSADLSPDGSKLYVADIGRNAIHTFHVSSSFLEKQVQKTISKRANDGPRHCWPHPNGKIVYVVQEHSCFVDIFNTLPDGSLEWVQGSRIIPSAENESDFWADEVRLSPSNNTLFTSTRGLTPEKNGYVTSHQLLPSGLFKDPGYQAEWITETSSSGGWANAISVLFPDQAGTATSEKKEEEVVYMTLTCSEKGEVRILKWTLQDGFEVVATQGGVEGASVTVWV